MAIETGEDPMVLMEMALQERMMSQFETQHIETPRDPYEDMTYE